MVYYVGGRKLKNEDKNKRVADYILGKIKELENKELFYNHIANKSNECNETINQFNFENLRRNVEDINNNWDVSKSNTIRSHRLVIGRLIDFVKIVIRKSIEWYINPIIKKQTIFNASLVRSINEMYCYIQENEKLDAELELIKNQLNQIIEGNNKIDKLESQLINTKAIVDKVKINYMDHLSQIKKNEKEVEKKIINQMQLLNEIKIHYDQMQQDAKAMTDSEYVKFENYFRGDENIIKERIKIYIPYIKDEKHYLDIGCGRGEMLELMSQEGEFVIGIDVNESMVDICKEKGYKAICIDALQYLESLDDDTRFDIVYMGQVVEHLSYSYRKRLFKVINSKLNMGGKLIVETPNPKILYTFINSFYLDPTHLCPVHPALLKYQLEEAAFEVLDVLGLSKTTNELELQLVSEANCSELNDNFMKINEIIFGYEDYSIVAKKREVY